MQRSLAQHADQIVNVTSRVGRSEGESADHGYDSGAGDYGSSVVRGSSSLGSGSHLHLVIDGFHTVLSADIPDSSGGGSCSAVEAFNNFVLDLLFVDRAHGGDFRESQHCILHYGHGFEGGIDAKTSACGCACGCDISSDGGIFDSLRGIFDSLRGISGIFFCLVFLGRDDGDKESEANCFVHFFS